MSGEIRVALAGVGSCASSFVQVVELARTGTKPLNGILYELIGSYRLSDVSFVAAFDVDRGKVGLDIAKAISTAPTAAVQHVEVAPAGITVEPGPLLDGVAGNLAGLIEPHPLCADVEPVQITRRLRETNADVLVCLLPTGATQAVQAYAGAAAKASVAFVNATPEPVVHDEDLVEEFVRHNAPLFGDDLRSHLGATTLHTALIELLHSRNLAITNTYQLNVGGNTDFLNLADPRRASSKLTSKRNALGAAGIDARRVAAGPNGFVEYLGDTKTCFLRIEAISVLDTEFVLDVRLQVEDSPNAAGVLASAVRLAKAAADIGQSGVIDAVCPMLFKSPRHGGSESENLRAFQAYVNDQAQRR